MNELFKRLMIGGGFLVLLSAALALPKEETEGNKLIRSPGVDEDFPNFQDEEPANQFSVFNLVSEQAGKLFNNFLQIPSNLFKFFSGVIASQPLAKLREEVRNLNISYPK